MAGNNAAVEGLSGAMGGITALLATYPLMTIQTLQATRRSADGNQGSGSGSLTVPVKRRQGTLADVAEVISQSGWTGLYRGLKPSLLGTTVSQGVYFYLYSLLRQAALRSEVRRGRGKNGDIGAGWSLVIPFLAGCGNVLLTNPIWVVATRMQAHHSSDSDARKASPPAVAKQIVEESGIVGLWRGVLPSLIMVVNPTINFLLYERLTARLTAWRRQQAGRAVLLGAGDVFAASAAAKLGATLACYPMQLLKTRLQAAGRHTHADRQYKGTFDAIARIWRSEGLPGFYKGMHTKIVQSILAAALLMAIKEKLTQAALVLLVPRPAAGARLSLTLKALP